MIPPPFPSPEAGVPGLTDLAHQTVRRAVRAMRQAEGDLPFLLVDATAGNGHDTLFLAQCAAEGSGGEVLALDVQQAALDQTRARLAAASPNRASLAGRTRFLLLGHEHLESCLRRLIAEEAAPARLAAVLFNLGFLPGSDKKCAAAGGVIGVCSYVPILWNRKRLPCIEDFVDAIAYYADLVGIDHVGIGIDSNSQPGAYERHETRRLMELAHPNRDVYLEGVEAGRGKACVYPEGLHSLANIVNIVEHMLKRGFLEEDVKKVLGENFLRVFDQTWRSKGFRLI